MNPRPVLLVDDNPFGRDIFATVLEHAGYPVVTAADGLEALRHLRATDPSLMLLDLVLPDVDGWEVIRQARAEPQLRDVPIVCLTAQAFPEDRDRAITLGCAGYLTKPVEPRMLLEEVRRLIGPPGVAEPS